MRKAYQPWFIALLLVALLSPLASWAKDKTKHNFFMPLDFDMQEGQALQFKFIDDLLEDLLTWYGLQEIVGESRKPGFWTQLPQTEKDKYWQVENALSIYVERLGEDSKVPAGWPTYPPLVVLAKRVQEYQLPASKFATNPLPEVQYYTNITLLNMQDIVNLELRVQTTSLSPRQVPLYPHLGDSAGVETKTPVKIEGIESLYLFKRGAPIVTAMARMPMPVDFCRQLLNMWLADKDAEGMELDQPVTDAFRTKVLAAQQAALASGLLKQPIYSDLVDPDVEASKARMGLTIGLIDAVQDWFIPEPL